MFKTHPNVSKITFVVMPQTHEYFHTSNDIPRDVYELIARYKPGATDAEGLIFDFSLLLNYAEPQLWSVLSLHNHKKQAELLAKIEEPFCYTQFVKATIEVLLSYSDSYENDKDIFERGQAFKRFMKTYLEMHPLPEGEKLAIVCHSKFICSLTATHVEEQDGIPAMQNFTWLTNC